MLRQSGIETTLTRQELNTASLGFKLNIRFDNMSVFVCPHCGIFPKYLVCDGKCCGLQKRKLFNTTELDRAAEDTEVLEQGSVASDRVFLTKKEEQSDVLDLLTGGVTLEDFVMSRKERSENFQMLVNVATVLVEKNCTEVPKPYKRFLANVAKATSVSGLLQPTGPRALEYLEMFANMTTDAASETLDLLDINNSEKLIFVIKEIPVFWSMISDIMKHDNARILSNEIATIVKRILKIRRDFFTNSSPRNQHEYFPWQGEEDHPTQFCPAFPLVKHPRKYDVYGRVDCDYCPKNFTDHKDFTPGVFSYSCACSYNITYGYEMMLVRESAHNLLRFLTCRDIDLDKLDGIIFDFACGFLAYALNREPQQFEYVRCLVDAAHWQGQKKTKKSDKRSKGHLGCSEGFNFKEYKPHLPFKANSQNREEMHSALEKISATLRPQNPKSYMTSLYVFFGLTNLKNMGRL